MLSDERWKEIEKEMTLLPGWFCSDYIKDITRDLYRELLRVEADRNKISIHGSDGCKNCETGRITIYAKSRWCLGCLAKVQAR